MGLCKEPNKKEIISYYEYEAKNVPMFNSLREISLAENILKGLPRKFSSVLDIGCGEGYLLFRIHRKNKKASLYGLDITKGRLSSTKKNVPSAFLVRADAASLPFPDNSIDAVICSEVLEHIPKYRKIIDEMIRISRKRIIITVPNDQPVTSVICPRCKTKHYLDGHVNRFDEESLREAFKNKGVVIRKIRRFHTIYSYNRVTLKLPISMRMLLDQSLAALHKNISFFKPNFLMIVLEKKR